MPIRAADSGATEGRSVKSSPLDASLVRLNEEARVTLLGSYKDNAWLRQSDRGIDVPNSAYYTLLPNTTDTKVAATVSRSLVRHQQLRSKHLSDVAVQPLVTRPCCCIWIRLTGESAQPLNASSAVRTSRVAMQLTGLLHDFVWGATVYYMHVASKSSSDLGIDNAGGYAIDRTGVWLQHRQSAAFAERPRPSIYRLVP